LISTQRDEFELDVVCVPDYKHRIPRLVVDRGMVDGQFGEACLPGLEFSVAGHQEADVVESGPGLGKRFVRVRGMRVQSYAHRPVGFAKHQDVAGAIGVGPSVSLVKPKTSVYQGVLRSMSVTVIPMWLIVAISGMVESGGRDRDAESVGDGV
jgi:hypothetical protein